MQPVHDPWAPSASVPMKPPQDPDSEFDFLRNEGLMSSSTAMTTHTVPPSYPPLQTNGGLQPQMKTKPEDFLGANSSLVNLDSLVGPTQSNGPALTASNPFLMTDVTGSAMQPPASNPFHQQRAPAPTINQMRQQPFQQPTVPTGSFHTSFPAAGEPSLPPPLLPVAGSTQPQVAQPNPFL